MFRVLHEPRSIEKLEKEKQKATLKGEKNEVKVKNSQNNHLPQAEVTNDKNWHQSIGTSDYVKQILAYWPNYASTCILGKTTLSHKMKD